jgi:hypothetical protein
VVITDYEERPEATSLLLQWPAVLTRFEFGSFYDNPHAMDYPMFESWVLIHKETLTRVVIGYLSNAGSNCLLNPKLFPNLDYLQLTKFQMVDPLVFSSEDANVLGPSLRTFAWNFSYNDVADESWWNFREPEANWVRELAKTAVSRKAALTKIKIIFETRSLWKTTEDMGYPWDRMDMVRAQTLRPNGMDLVYNKPFVSKDVCLHYIKTGEFEAEGPETVFIPIGIRGRDGIDEQEGDDALMSELQSAHNLHKHKGVDS